MSREPPQPRPQPPTTNATAPLPASSDILNDFDHVELWCPSLENGHLFSLPPLINADSTFVAESQTYRFPFGCGTPGRVWESQCAEAIEDIASVDERFYLRRSRACRAGYRALVSVPVHAAEMPGGFPACVFVGYTKRGRSLPGVVGLQYKVQKIFSHHPYVQQNMWETTCWLRQQHDSVSLRALSLTARSRQIGAARARGARRTGEGAASNPDPRQIRRMLLELKRSSGLNATGYKAVTCGTCRRASFREGSSYGDRCEVCISATCVNCTVVCTGCTCPRQYVCGRCVVICEGCQSVCCMECSFDGSKCHRCHAASHETSGEALTRPPRRWRRRQLSVEPLYNGFSSAARAAPVEDDDSTNGGFGSGPE